MHGAYMHRAKFLFGLLARQASPRVPRTAVQAIDHNKVIVYLVAAELDKVVLSFFLFQSSFGQLTGDWRFKIPR